MTGRPPPRRAPVPARATDPGTSHAAAADRRRVRESQCLQMLAAYVAAGEQGCTADEAAEWAGLRDPLRSVCFWHRASDLRDMLLITSLDPPRRRLGYSGRPQDVKVITEAGRAAHAARALPRGR